MVWWKILFTTRQSENVQYMSGDIYLPTEANIANKH